MVKKFYALRVMGDANSWGLSGGSDNKPVSVVLASDYERVEAALAKYARHTDPSCAWWHNKPCDCGLDDALKGSPASGGTVK